MSDILDRVLEHCVGRRWSCARLPDRPVLEVRFDVGWTRWSAFVRVDQGQILTIRSLYPEPVPEARRSVVAEYLTRANWGLLVGNFEMDWRYGEARFKTSLDLAGEPLSEGVLEALFDANTQGYRQYVGGLAAVIAGSATPAEAVADADS